MPAIDELQIDNDAQRAAREGLALALHIYWLVYYCGEQGPFPTWEQLSWVDRKRAVQWLHEAEYAAFLRPTRKD